MCVGPSVGPVLFSNDKHGSFCDYGKMIDDEGVASEALPRYLIRRVSTRKYAFKLEWPASFTYLHPFPVGFAASDRSTRIPTAGALSLAAETNGLLVHFLVSVPFGSTRGLVDEGQCHLRRRISWLFSLSRLQLDSYQYRLTGAQLNIGC